MLKTVRDFWSWATLGGGKAGAKFNEFQNVVPLFPAQ